jgi:hypothetical protein
MLSSSLGKPSSPLAADGPWPVMRPTPASPPVSSSPHQLVPVSAFGPPSPSGSEKSLSDNAPLSTIPPSKRHHNLASMHVQSPSEFASAYPTIEELEQMDPDEVLFPSVPRHDPGQKPILPYKRPRNSDSQEATERRRYQAPSLQFVHHEQRPASTPPIPINSARMNGFSHSPPSPRHTRYPSGSPLNPSYNSPKTNGNTDSGVLTALLVSIFLSQTPSLRADCSSFSSRDSISSSWMFELVNSSTKSALTTMRSYA